MKCSASVVGVCGGNRRSPCGERGLKWAVGKCRQNAEKSLPVRGAWIEINGAGDRQDADASLPVRGAWIEISGQGISPRLKTVAPRAGSVD